MPRPSLATLLVSLAVLFAVAGPLAAPSLARPREPEDERPKPSDPPAWKEPVIQGEIIGTHWSEGRDPNQKTATIVVWSVESDLAVNVYGDDPRVREVIVNGTACVGRYAIVGGDREDEYSLIGRSIEVQRLEAPCRESLASPGGTQSQPATTQAAPPTNSQPPTAPSDLPYIPYVLPPLQPASEDPPASP